MKVCEITGKVAVIGNNVSHSHHKTKRKFSPNLKNKRFWSEEEGRWITLKVSAAGIKTINKKLPHPKRFTKTQVTNGKERQQSAGDSRMHGTES